MAHRPVIMGTEFAISAGHYLAAQAGYEVLAAGGNAIDAGVAAGFTLGVVQSDLVNVAGVAPILVHVAATAEVISLAGLGTWPAAATCEYFAREHGGEMPEGIARTVVPAAPAAWLEALARWGTMPYAEVAAAAIRHAREGFVVDRCFAEFVAEHEAGYRRWPQNARIYLPHGRPPREGERFVQRDLAATLTHLADEERAAAGKGREAGIRAARDAFYRGDVARAIAAYHREHGGLLTRDDLAGYRVREEPTARVRFRGLDVHCCGPWTQGPALAQILGILEGADLESHPPGSIACLHLVAEAIKLAFADRERWVGDPCFVDVPLAGMLDPGYLAARRALVDPQRAWPDLPPPGDPRRGRARLDDAAPPAAAGAVQGLAHAETAGGRDTSYVCVIDRDGNAFSATPSDTSYDAPVIPGLGIVPSSRGSQSRTDPAHRACVAPGKRPRLTPNPALALRDGRPAIAFGTPGGDVQIQAMAQFLVNAVVFGMDVQSAIEAPRIASFSHPSSFAPFEHFPGLLAAEARIEGEVREGLAALGHRVEAWPQWTRRAGSLCAIRVDETRGVLHAGADPRRAGYALAR